MRLLYLYIIPIIIAIIAPVYTSAQGLFESTMEAPGTSGSDLYSLGGGVRSVVYTGYNEEDDLPYLQSIYSQLDLDIEMPAANFGKAYADLRFRYGHEYGSRIASAELRELYTELYFGPVTFSAGKKILSWGTSGFINPSDHFSPVNPVFRSPDPDELKMGTWVLNTMVNLSRSSRFGILWFPDHSPSVLLTESFQMPGYIRILPYSSVTETFCNNGFGLQYDLRSGLLDLQLSYYNGFRNTPVIYTENFSVDTTSFAPEQLLLSQQPARIHSAGMNLTVPVGSLLIRTEVGWLDAIEDSLSAAPLTELAYTLELEQPGSNVVLIGGYYGKYIFDFEPSSVETSLFEGEFPSVSDLFPAGTPPNPGILNEYVIAQVKGFNRMYEYQQAEFMHAAYGILDISMFNDLAAIRLPAMYNFTTEELTLMPSLKFNITDGLTAEAGAYLLKGKEGSLYQLVGSSLNAGYLQIHLKF